MKRILVALFAVVSVIVGGGLAMAAVIPPGTNGPGLAAVGPVSATDGFPVWYKDNNGVRLEPCIAQADPFCPARGDLPDETAPVSFPNNYPDEGFYDLADTGNLPSGFGGRARAVIALEQGFRNGPVVDGDQVTFARVRVKVSNLPDNTNYTFTTPAGTKVLQTSGKQTGLIFDTEDIGIGGVGDFSGALGGRIGPFLTWDTFPNDPSLKPAAGKDTYVGDGATPHAITGSPYGPAFNVFRIQGPGINPTPTVDACPTVPGPIADCMETNLFTVQGKVATTSGVTAQQATYSRSSGGSGTIDVFASSESGPQAIQVSDVSPGGPAFNPTGLTGSNNGQFFARVAYTGSAPPATLQVSNTGDVPVSNQRINVVDAVTGTASFNTGSQQLTVNAVSSDTANSRTLTVKGYGSISSGTYVSGSIGAPPASVTVTSDAGGSAVLPVTITGNAAAPIPAIAQAGPDQTVASGQLVTLDGSASTNAQTFSWTSPPGITLHNDTTPTPTFTAPAPGAYTFQLTVTGPGGPSSASVTITVNAAVTAVANAGPNQTGIQRGTKVTLDATKSTGAGTYAWTQVAKPGDPTVTLTGANTAQPTFTFPLYKFPANNGPLSFNLTVSSPDGSSSQAQVTVAPSSDTVALAKGQYTASKKEWRIDGSSNVLAGETVTVHLGGLDGPVLGTTIIEADGTFSVRTTTTGIVGKAGQTVSVESQLGGSAAGFVIKLG
jgi:hypothetical protein